MDDLNAIAQSAVRIHIKWWPFGDRADQYDSAWEGIAERLCVSNIKPTRDELIYAGTEMVRRDVRAKQRDRPSFDGTMAAGFSRYWSWHAQHQVSPESSVVDKTAFHQVWEVITPANRKALTALAVAGGDARLAADTQRCTLKAMEGRVRRARQEFLHYWFDGETPRPMWRKTRYSGLGPEA
jgi:hypothetical protein